MQEDNIEIEQIEEIEQLFFCYFYFSIWTKFYLVEWISISPLVFQKISTSDNSISSFLFLPIFPRKRVKITTR